MPRACRSVKTGFKAISGAFESSPPPPQIFHLKYGTKLDSVLIGTTYRCPVVLFRHTYYPSVFDFPRKNEPKVILFPPKSVY